LHFAAPWRMFPQHYSSHLSCAGVSQQIEMSINNIAFQIHQEGTGSTRESLTKVPSQWALRVNLCDKVKVLSKKVGRTAFRASLVDALTYDFVQLWRVIHRCGVHHYRQHLQKPPLSSPLLSRLQGTPPVLQIARKIL